MIVYSLRVIISPGFRVLELVVPCARKLKKQRQPITEKTRIRVFTSSLWNFLRWVPSGPGSGRGGGDHVLKSSTWRWMLLSRALAFLISLLSLQYSFLQSLFYFVLSQERTWLIVLSSLWMGHAMYFSLGNSNSLASIDVSAGYVGLEDYAPGVVGPLMYVATYCGPILWLIAAVLSIVRDARDIKR